MNQITCVVTITILFIACNRHPSQLEQALTLAGDNRPELEKVLSHYSVNPEDSLKYKAAVFLIENMAGHNSVVLHDISETISDIKQLAIRIKREQPKISEYRASTIALDSMRKIRGQNLNFHISKQRDVEQIKANYLIADIDLAFHIRDEIPWGRQVAFKDFCELILPYRISNEGIKSWRQTYYDRFRHIADSLPPNPTPVQACRVLYDELQKEIWYHVDALGLPFSLDAQTLLDYHFGSCREKTEFTLFAMRALCIPGSIDMFIQTPDKMYPYHFWNQMKDSSGRPIEFLLWDNLPPEEGRRDTTRKKGIIYRLNYVAWSKALSLRVKTTTENIPERLQNIHIADVSAEYRPGSMIKITANKKKSDILYLCLFNNQKWIPVVYSEIKHSKALFYGLEANIAYLPTYYIDRTVIPAQAPFLLEADNRIRYLLPDTVCRQQLALERKHPFPSRLNFMRRLIVGGRLEGANSADFHNADILHTITDANDFKRTTINCADTSKKYRYARYLSANGGKCNIAELQFSGRDGAKLDGRIIGTKESHATPTNNLTAVFDNDPLTFYESLKPSCSWVGLDFGCPQQIEHIVFQFRSDDNNIRPGDFYELFYWDNGQWNSLGQKTGDDSYVLAYKNCPSGALFLLHNHTRGKEERPFTYENGKQIFW
ncbi:MAG: discoidin domain-containing protein [Tannerellaceae bacterium]|jgi:hypothetical protein|nr:discoidin domain-containing protein [Tannerellaceae bacterium]